MRRAALSPAPGSDGGKSIGLSAYPPGSDEQWHALRTLVGAESISELQKALGLTKHQYYNYLKKGTLPHKAISQYCIANELSIDRFYYGRSFCPETTMEFGGQRCRIVQSGLLLDTGLAESSIQWLLNPPAPTDSELPTVYRFQRLKPQVESVPPSSVFVQLFSGYDRDSGRSLLDNKRHLVLIGGRVVERLIYLTSAGYSLASIEGAGIGGINEGTIVGRIIAAQD